MVSVALALCAVGCSQPEEVKRPPAKRPAGVPGAEFAIPVLGTVGGDIQLKDHAGQVVLLDFWATWCLPCRKELPALNALYRDFEPRGFSLIGMTVDQGEQSKVADAVGKLAVGYPVGWADGSVQEAYGGIRVVPTKVLLDKNGAVVKRYEGVVSPEVLRADIEELLAL